MKEPISRILNITYKAHGLDFQDSDEARAERVHWGEDFFGLNKSGVWLGLAPKSKQQLLESMTQNLLLEAYHIECAGMIYTAKMNMKAESEDERAFYCMMGQEEAGHRALLKPFLNENSFQKPRSSFAQLIGKIIETADRRSSLFLIQVLLEGWGIDYYCQLGEASKSQDLSLIFQRIVKDETRHHGAGTVLFESAQSLETKAASSNEQIQEYLKQILEMVRVGPWNLMTELKMAAPELSKHQVLKILQETSAVQVTQQKIQRLRRLCERQLSAAVIDQLIPVADWQAMDTQQMCAAIGSADF